MGRDGNNVPGIEHGPVSAWLAANIAGARPPFRFQVIAGGNSNLTYRVTGADGSDLALRRPPLSRVLATAHDMVREFRVIAALGGTGVPVPPALGLCEEPEVNGAPFYVMGFVEGTVPHDIGAGEEFPPRERRAAAEGAVEALAALHALSPEEVGLGELGRREDYVARQISRWARQWEAVKQREIPEMEEARARLRARIPPQERDSIVHGDFRWGNLIVDGGRVRAVVDWELCTLGDPLADVGYLANDWAGPDEEALWVEPVTKLDGFPDRGEMLSRYARAAGADLSGIGFYRAFQYWRLGAILEGVYSRYRHGARGDAGEADLPALAAAVPRLAQAALSQLDE